MKTKILPIVQKIDRSYMKFFPEKPHIAIALFHKIFETQADVDLDQTLPTEKLTIADFEKILIFFQEQNYQFISPKNIEQGNFEVDKKYILLTFDDGYFNNTYILPLLEKYNAPALFFISTAYTEEEQPYWWDIFYRESRKKGIDFQSIIAQIEVFKTWKRSKIVAYLEKEYGKKAFIWQDLDRPLTLEELQKFATHKLVYIGNHTHEHYALANWDRKVAQEQIKICQSFLKKHLNLDCKWFAYPNGSNKAETIALLEEMKIPFAVTIHREKNYFPLQNTRALGRFSLPLYYTQKHLWQMYRTDRKPIFENFIRTHLLKQKI